LSAMLLIPSVKFVILLLSTLIILLLLILLSAYFAPVIKLSGYHNRLFNNILVIFEKSTSLILPDLIVLSAYLLFVIELSGMLLTLNIKFTILLQSRLIILLLLILLSAIFEPVRKLSTK